MNVIKKATSFEFNKSLKTLVIEGTNKDQIGDIVADALLLVPKRMKHGWVSWSMYQQAEQIFDEVGQDIMSLPTITLSGHSLGGSVALLLACKLLESGYGGTIKVIAWGAPKVLSYRMKKWLAPRVKNVIWRVNHRDIVPHLGWWQEPIHNTVREGIKRKHPLDWSFKAHLSY